VTASSSGLGLRSTLGAAWTYRAELEPLWRVPVLTDDGDPIEMAEELTGWQVELAPLLVPAPPSDQFNDHAAAVAAFVAGLDPWKTEYLDRLAGGDRAGAGQSLDQMRAQLDGLAADLSALTETMLDDASADLNEARQALAMLSP
jgi:hypothetical protein